MTHRAIIQGDWHASRRDAQTLLDRRTKETDALFIEGRSPVIQLKHHTMGYILFLIGYLSIEVIYRTSEWIYETVPGGEEWNVEDAGREVGLDVKSEIDAELDEIWSLAEGNGRSAFYGLTLLMFAYALGNSIVGSSAFGIPSGLTSIIIAVGAPLAFSGLVVIFLGKDGVRDEIMVESIIDASEKEKHSEVLILCGDKHVPGMSEKFRKAGWEVDNERSTHPMSSVSRLL